MHIVVSNQARQTVQTHAAAAQSWRKVVEHTQTIPASSAGTQRMVRLQSCRTGGEIRCAVQCMLLRGEMCSWMTDWRSGRHRIWFTGLRRVVSLRCAGRSAGLTKRYCLYALHCGGGQIGWGRSCF